jgi:hypothetical protein
MLAGRQHGDDHIGTFHGARSALCDAGTVGLGLVAGGLGEVESNDLVAAHDQIGGHGAAHVTETDECDRGHLGFLR